VHPPLEILNESACPIPLDQNSSAPIITVDEQPRIGLPISREEMESLIAP